MGDIARNCRNPGSWHGWRVRPQSEEIGLTAGFSVIRIPLVLPIPGNSGISDAGIPVSVRPPLAVGCGQSLADALTARQM
ncbi:hypothetical protein XFF6991_280153 [Xanthomonas phaseoli pv. phaseoli]|uniref:Uncharacterized protein n=1 Tax=Xanthomonas campestris pv. phaseoli TaxID=317013 RepID=A0A7Z7J013_XANCH|nr:hypothetical protein XFF6991_280153 [Xanthomonas phaseoli pv. phaseoli]